MYIVGSLIILFVQAFQDNKNDTLSFEDVKASLLYKEKFDLEVRAENGKDLLVKGESFDNRNTNKSKFQRHKSNKFCKYYSEGT